MLPKAFRGLSQIQIQKLFDNKKVLKSKYVALRYELTTHSSDNENVKFAVGVSNKLFKTAVEKNKLRRIVQNNLSELVSNHAEIAKLPFNIFVLLYRQPETDFRSQLLSELQKLLKQ